MKNILFIGCGHMGSALLSAWIKDKNNKITVVDPLKYKHIKKKYKIDAFESANLIQNVNIFDIVVLAVTPQLVDKVLEKYKLLRFKKTCVIVSIIAGKKINILKKAIPNVSQMIRVMPNMPALVGESVSFLVSSRNTSNKNKNNIYKLFSQVGIVFWLKKEEEIDIATAISGSGPGYIFYLINALEEAANELGFNKKINQRIILQTLIGSLKLIQHSKKSSKKLANEIAIKGGTTEAGIKVLKKNNINKILSQTLKSAYKKAIFLSKK